MKQTLLQRFALWLLKKSDAGKFIPPVVTNHKLEAINLSYTTTYPHFTDIEHNKAHLRRLSDITKHQREIFKQDIYRYFDQHLDDLIETDVYGSQVRMSLKLYHKNLLTRELKEL